MQWHEPLRVRKGVLPVVGAVGLGSRVVMTNIGRVVRGAVRHDFDHHMNTGEQEDEL